MNDDDEMWADEAAEWERADAAYNVLEDLALPLIEDACRAAASGDTVHRLAPRDGEAHRSAAFPMAGRVAFTVGSRGTGNRDRRLQAGGFDPSVALDDLLGDAEPCRLTLVAVLANDPRTVEIVDGLAVGVEWTDEHGVEVVRFVDGDYVHLDDVISLRVEVQA